MHDYDREQFCIQYSIEHFSQSFFLSDVVYWREEIYRHKNDATLYIT